MCQWAKMILKQSPHIHRENSTKGNEIRNNENRNREIRPDRFLEFIEILSGEMNLRLSQEMVSLMNVI